MQSGRVSVLAVCSKGEKKRVHVLVYKCVCGMRRGDACVKGIALGYMGREDVWRRKGSVP